MPFDLQGQISISVSCAGAAPVIGHPGFMGASAATVHFSAPIRGPSQGNDHARSGVRGSLYRPRFRSSISWFKSAAVGEDVRRAT